MDRVNFQKFPHLYLIRVRRIRVNIIYRRNEISYLLFLKGDVIMVKSSQIVFFKRK